MKDFQITLIDKKEICENTLGFWFDIKNTEYAFKAGQYAHFTIINPKFKDSKGNFRALSIASSPQNKNDLMVAARKNSSVFINNLYSIPIGSKIFISKPSGNLILHKDLSIPSVFIAGGIGITPIRSITEEIIQKNSEHEVYLFYSNRTSSQTAFLDEFTKWSEDKKNFKFIPIIDDKNNKNWNYEYGPIKRDLFKKYLNTFNNKIYYAVGPPLMVDSIKEILLTEKVSEERIKIEKFR